ncbi:Spy/CpxP family protein refolding chaperone [bacterium]|nr:Spy/CpxP family protein refolding chaperone [bacterium]
MKPFSILSIAAFILFTNTSVYGQEKNITVITDMDHDDGHEFFAFFPDMPSFDDFESMDMDENQGFAWNDEAGAGLPIPPGMPDDLNLTKDQAAKMKQIRNAARKQNIPLKGDMQLKQMELQDLMAMDSPDKNAIAVKVKEIDAIRTQIKLNKMNARIDCRNVLTKEQKEKMEQMRSQRRMMHFDGGKHKMKFKRELRGE